MSQRINDLTFKLQEVQRNFKSTRDDLESMFVKQTDRLRTQMDYLQREVKDEVAKVVVSKEKDKR